jgi:hypothetical protein
MVGVNVGTAVLVTVGTAVLVFVGTLVFVAASVLVGMMVFVEMLVFVGMTVFVGIVVEVLVRVKVLVGVRLLTGVFVSGEPVAVAVDVNVGSAIPTFANWDGNPQTRFEEPWPCPAAFNGITTAQMRPPVPGIVALNGPFGPTIATPSVPSV